MRSETFDPDCWTVPIKDGLNAADIASIRVRGLDGLSTATFLIPGTITPPPDVRRALLQHLGDYRGKIRIESLGAKSEVLGSKNFTFEGVKVTTTQPAPPLAPPPDPSAFSSLNALAQRLADMCSMVTKSNGELVESIRKSKQDAPDFFVELYKSALKKIEDLQKQVLTLTSERDVAVTLLQKSKENPAQAHAIVEGLKELRGLAGTAVPTVPQLLQKLIQSLLEGKTEDLITLLKEQSMAARVRIVVGLTLAAVEATPLEERGEFLERSQAELRKGLGIPE